MTTTTNPDAAPDPLRLPTSRSAYFTLTGMLTPEGRQAILAIGATFHLSTLAVRQASAQFGPLAALLQEAQRGPTIGRARRARRARGRARQIKTTAYTHQ